MYWHRFSGLAAVAFALTARAAAPASAEPCAVTPV
jgi:hypothetical protein